MGSDEVFGGLGAAEAGRRSGEARRRRKLMTPEERVRDAITAKSDRLIQELLKAAFGEEEFADLKLETRVSTATRLLEWQLGRPAASKAPPQEPEDTTPKDGDDLFE